CRSASHLAPIGRPDVRKEGLRFPSVPLFQGGGRREGRKDQKTKKGRTKIEEREDKSTGRDVQQHLFYSPFSSRKTLESSLFSFLAFSIATSCPKLGCKLDLDFIVRNTWNCEYNPKTFPAITIRIRKPRSTARLFRNGTLVCAGATSTDESHRAARKFARIVQKLNFPVRLLNFQIKNIVSCGKFFPVHLADVRQAYSKKCSYHPELFPSLFFRGLPGVTATVSPSGSIILNGKFHPTVYQSHSSYLCKHIAKHRDKCGSPIPSRVKDEPCSVALRSSKSIRIL
uniref:Uncharacterized protein n=1 Tax=Poecilia latipinna TaxID=48699 RepID=A0A3B3VH37_9TELE